MDSYTHITIALDRSGSMQSVREATIAGFNEFMKGQREAPGKLTLSLIGFDDQYESWARMAKPDYVLTEETFVPRGWTALHDAMGRSIIETGEDLKRLPESERPSKVVYAVMTDGLENRSKEHSVTSVAEMIKLQQSKYGWTFFFIGANQDAILSASRYGISMDTAMNYTPAPGTTLMALSGLGTSVLSARAGKSPAFSVQTRTAALGPRRK